MENYVWYACYGSNINYDRFMRYINACSDTAPPTEARPFVFDHSIYFAKSSALWDNGGIAFLDDTAPGRAYGRIYKITARQYEEVKAQEGCHYRKKLDFGFVDGLPVYSFTDMQRNEPLRLPSDSYFSTILRGLRDCRSDCGGETPAAYLISTAFPGRTFAVAEAIHRSGTGLTAEAVSVQTGLPCAEVCAAIGWLEDCGALLRDGQGGFRSAAEAHCGGLLLEAAEA